MRRTFHCCLVFLVLGGSLFLLSWESARSSGTPSGGAGTLVAGQECLGKAEQCKPEIRFLGEKDGCACFTCQTGTKNEHVVCTKEEKDKTVLFQLSVKTDGENKGQRNLKPR